VGIATRQDNVTTKTCVTKNENHPVSEAREWSSGVESQVSGHGAPCKKNRHSCRCSSSLAKVRAASATPTMRDEDSRQTRSFVIYWSLHFDVTEMPDESRVLRRTCDY